MKLVKIYVKSRTFDWRLAYDTKQDPRGNIMHQNEHNVMQECVPY